MKKIKILDTTLRDGEQAPGMAIEPEAKAYLASVLDDLGVDVIELGFPAASRSDFEAVSSACKKVKKSEVAVLARVNEKDIDCARQALQCAGLRRLHLTISTSTLHMKKKLNMNSSDVISAAVNALKYAKGKFDSIEMGAEDATRSDPGFLAEFFAAVSDAGADVLNIADTVGIAAPKEMYSLVKKIHESSNSIKTGRSIISIHCHNDLGLALANTIAGIEAGAEQVEVSLLGLGERAGNAALEELMAFLSVTNLANVNINKKKLGAAMKAAAKVFCVPPAKNKAVAGANAFSHGSGIHQNGVLKDPFVYEIIRPEEFGIEPGGIVISRHSGRSGIESRIEKISGIRLSVQELNRIADSIEKVCYSQKLMSDTDILLLLQEHGIYSRIVYALESVEVMSSEEGYRVFLKLSTRGGSNIETIFTGKNPFEAVFGAVRKCTGTGFDIRYFTFSAAGSEDQYSILFYLEGERDGAAERAEIYSDDLYKAAALAYVELVNRVCISGRKEKVL